MKRRTQKRTKGNCAHCGQYLNIYWRGLCHTCYWDVDIREQYPSLHEVTASIYTKLRDDWELFKAHYGREWAPSVLADRYGCDEAIIWRWVAKNDSVAAERLAA